jgi:trigger factor
MEINVEKLGPCKAKISIVIPTERIKEELEKTYQQTAGSVTFPGFRKGKAPRKLIIKRFGDIINADVKEKLVQEAYTEALEENKIEPAGEPSIDLDALTLDEEQPMEFDFELEIRPEFELGEYKDLEVELEAVAVNDEEIDEGIKAIRSRFATLEAVEDQPVSRKHYLTTDVVYRVEGEEEDLSREGVQANMGLGVIDGIEASEALEGLVDKKVGEKAEITIDELPPHFMPEHLRGKAAKLDVTVKEVREVVFPEVNDDFLEKVGMKTVDELREKVSKEVLNRKNAKREEEIDAKIVDRLIEGHSFELPEKLLMQQIQSQEQNLKYEMLRMGMPPDKIEEEAGKFDERNREAAERNIRTNFVFDKIADAEKIYVTENEVEQELKIIAQQQNSSVQDVKRYYEEQNMLGVLRNFLRNQKIRKMLRENAKMVEKDARGAAQTEAEEADDQEGEGSA